MLRKQTSLLWVVVLAAATITASPASAQMLEDDIRIGIILPTADEDAAGTWQGEVREQVEHGATIAEEDHALNAQMLGVEFEVLFETAEGAEQVVEAAERLVAAGAYGVAGGYTIDEALALGDWADAKGVPFLNIGVQSDLLRNDMCAATTFHVEASAGMYLDALAGWYVRDGYRRWFIVHSDTDEGGRLYERLQRSITERHFAVGEVASTPLVDEVDGAAIAEAVEVTGADLLVLLVDAEEQLEIMAGLQEAGFTGEVAAYPHPETQTREFFAELVAVAPDIDHYRIVLWEPTLDTSGSIEFNARYRNRFDGETMDGAAFAAYHAVKILFDSAFFGASVDPADIVTYMSSPNAVFDLHKLLGVSFRPWDHQLRQPIYLVQVRPDAESAFDSGLLVGQLPELYLPGTDPLERLDQIGDLAADSTCGFAAP